MNLVLFCKKSCDTGRKIAQALGEGWEGRFSPKRGERYKAVLLWGNYARQSYPYPGVCKINEHGDNACNKTRMIGLFEYNDIPHPETINYDPLSDDYFEKYPGVWQKIIDFPKEYRVLGGVDKEGNPYIYEISLKKEREGEEVDPFLKKHSTGWRFIAVKKEWNKPQKVIETCLKVFRVFKTRFSAIDISYNSEYNEVCVFEINSSPGLIDRKVIEWVVKVIKEEVD